MCASLTSQRLWQRLKEFPFGEKENLEITFEAAGISMLTRQLISIHDYNFNYPYLKMNYIFK